MLYGICCLFCYILQLLLFVPSQHVLYWRRKKVISVVRRFGRHANRSLWRELPTPPRFLVLTTPEWNVKTVAMTFWYRVVLVRARWWKRSKKLGFRRKHRWRMEATTPPHPYLHRPLRPPPPPPPALLPTPSSTQQRTHGVKELISLVDSFKNVLLQAEFTWLVDEHDASKIYLACSRRYCK